MELAQFPNKPDLHGVDGVAWAVRGLACAGCDVFGYGGLEWSLQRVGMTMSEIIWASVLVDSRQLVWFGVGVG